MLRKWLIKKLRKRCEKCDRPEYNFIQRGYRGGWKKVSFKKCDYCEMRRLERYKIERLISMLMSH